MEVNIENYTSYYSSIDNYTLESFINFCNSYQNVNEGDISNFAKKVGE